MSKVKEKPESRRTGRITISDEEYWEIAADLQTFHSIFSSFWGLGKICFCDFIPTACIKWDKQYDRATFYFNGEFWDSLDHYSRTWVICHEMLHIILNHGVRGENLKYPKIANCAMDIVINHLTVNQFGFVREQINNAMMFDWVDTVFPPEEDVPDNKHVEWYYEKLVKDAVKIVTSLVDDHGQFGGGEGKESEGKGKGEEEKDNGFSDIIDELDDALSDQDKEKLKDMIESHFQPPEGEEVEGGEKGGEGRGIGSGGRWSFPDWMAAKVVQKRKWEEVIFEWAKKYYKPDLRGVERWGRPHRRLTDVRRFQPDIHLPCEIDVERLQEEEHMIDVFFFLDTSGSCSGLEERFWNAARSLPDDKFTVHLYTFNDAVYPVDVDTGRMNIGGGTSFDILENYVQQEIANNVADGYPEAVFVITDGLGNQIQPEEPKKWYWFLTNSGNTSCIPEECHTFGLKDFE